MYSLYVCVCIQLRAHATQMLLSRQLCRCMGSLEALATGTARKGGLHKNKMCPHLEVISWRRGAGALQECGCVGDITHVGPGDVYVLTCA